MPILAILTICILSVFLHARRKRSPAWRSECRISAWI
ncbi:TPA: hypothetical protein ACF6OP_004146 [Salmonella enterica subsp. enterica serovar Weltevreden]